MKRACVFPCALAVLAVLTAANAVGGGPDRGTPLVLPNGDFEKGGQGWTITPGETMTTFSAERARSGKTALRVADGDDKQGSSATGPRVPVPGAGAYRLHAQAFPVSGSGLGVYVRVLDRDGKLIGSQDDHQRAAPAAPVGQWVPFMLDVYTPDEAAFLEVWVHSYGAARVTAFLDDLRFVALGNDALRPPWPGTYKIKPNETARLTAADVVGPDGVVYPDWRWAGVPGGIPKVLAASPAEDFGARAGDDRDDSDAIERGAAAVGRNGGGALVLGPGTYHLDRPVLIGQNNVVLRGAGADKTKLLFRYAAPPGGVGFFRPLAGKTVTSSTWIEAHAQPRDLREIAIEIDGKPVAKTTYYPQHWGGTFSLRTGGANVVNKVKDGAHTLRAVATYADGRRITSDLPVRTEAAASGPPARIPSQIAAIMFVGGGTAGPERRLARDGKRGDRDLVLEAAPAVLRAGDRIRLRAPATPRWNALVRNACQWGEYRRYEFVVEKVAGARVRLNQPLRLDFPVIDGSYVQKIEPLRRCGVEDLTLEQTQELWTSGIVFSNAWECWARGVTVKKAGRFPLYFLQAKWGEIRDCVMDDAWYKGGGGTAYVGWEYACDGLMENVTTRKMRHAPCVQWAASGNVIRKSTFEGSDAQWHSGWTNENLFEQCVVTSATGDGGYGYGMWASPPEDEAHGPNGPRNVVYHCDVRSPKTGLWMGGMNENWLILHNRFVVGAGPGVFAKTASFDHILRGNVFLLADPKQPAVFLATPDCVGVELTGNQVLGGNGKISGGAGRPAVDQGNRLMPAGDAPRPQPAVPSIFEWQRAQRR
uniref:Uncharacterized protein n=1 Tax=uncultured Armatimonadetes bacterium TaxID=157466 RepID=A0A6J4H3U6_9BACT|nr:hypothetical protein AVDCRST_MAG63-86 [uncultured Armatimonadetes bacterium]